MSTVDWNALDPTCTYRHHVICLGTRNSFTNSAECPRSLQVGCPCSWYERLQLESMPPLWLHTYSLSRMLSAAFGFREGHLCNVKCYSYIKLDPSHLFPIFAKNLKAKTFRYQTCGSSPNGLNRIHGMIRWTGQDHSTSTSKDLTLTAAQLRVDGSTSSPRVSPSAPAQWWAPLAGALAGIFQVSPGAKIYRVLDLDNKLILKSNIIQYNPTIHQHT